MTTLEIKLDIVEKLVREKAYDGYNPQVDTVKNWFKSRTKIASRT